MQVERSSINREPKSNPIGRQGEQHLLSSSQGVRQGDPFGPLFFSLGVRPLLDRLSAHLGPHRLVLAYLDDVYILSHDSTVPDDVSSFFSDHPSSLHLNLAKSATHSIDTITRDGLKVLGSCVGSADRRAAFLQGKIEEQERTLGKLPGLPHQHALLVLRECLQQNLRHLLRSLRSDDLGHLWTRYDRSLRHAVLQMQGLGQDEATGTVIPGDARTKSGHLISLPAKLGGLGILSMLECAPLAYAASSEASDRLLQPLLTIQTSGGGHTDDDITVDHAPVRSQKDRCTEVFEARRERLLSALSTAEAQAVQESATYLGRRWLSIIPFNTSLKLSDFELSAALHHRTLGKRHRSFCEHCGLSNEVMHDEVCQARPLWRIARHEQLKHALADALARSSSLGKLTIEPFVPGTQLRTDIALSGCQARGNGPQEFDLTILSLASTQFRSTDQAKNTIQAILGRAAQAKRTKYASRTASKFVPLVLSLGGAMEKECSKTLQGWRDHMPVGTHSFLLKRISILLLRARFRFYEG